VQYTKKERVITKARNTENTKGKSLDRLMNIERPTSNVEWGKKTYDLEERIVTIAGDGILDLG